MSKVDREASFWSALMQAGLYKRNQGRLARQLTAGAVFAAVVLGAWALSVHVMDESHGKLQYVIPGIFALAGTWVAYRLVNYPAFADFLIDVEGEMAKVTWASKDEIKRATVVVLTTMVSLSVVLFLYDLIWLQVLKWIGILHY